MHRCEAPDTSGCECIAVNLLAWAHVRRKRSDGWIVRLREGNEVKPGDVDLDGCAYACAEVGPEMKLKLRCASCRIRPFRLITGSEAQHQHSARFIHRNELEQLPKEQL